MRNTNINKILGRNIATVRKAMGLTQQQLAEQVGVSQSLLAYYENGRISVPLSVLTALAKALRSSVDELLGATATHSKVEKRGPRSKIEHQIDLVRKLPRPKQAYVATFLEQVLATSAKG